MVFNPSSFHRATRGDRLNKMAEDLGFDGDDFANESTEGMVQKVSGAKEFMRAKAERNNELEVNPSSDEVVYQKCGVDEYRMTYRTKKGWAEFDKTLYPDMGAIVEVNTLFKENKFATEQLPIIFEDEYGNIFERRCRTEVL